MGLFTPDAQQPLECNAAAGFKTAYRKKTELTDATWGNVNTANVITSPGLKLGKATSDIMVARSAVGPLVSTSCYYVIWSFYPNDGICCNKICSSSISGDGHQTE